MLALRGILCLPAVASAFVVSLVVRIKVSEGFWAFSPFADPPDDLCCAVHLFDRHGHVTMLFWLLGVLVALASPILIGTLWMLRDRPTHRFLVPFIVSVALLAYTLGDVRGWTEWCFD